MKRMLLLFSVLIFVGTSLAQEVGVITEFSNRRPAFQKIKGVFVAAGDVNGDGIAEITTVQACSLKVHDPVTRNVLWEFCLSSLPGNVWDDTDIVHVIGFPDFSGTKHALITIEPDDGNNIIAILIALMSKQVAYMEEERVVAVLQLRNGRQVILTYVEQQNLFRLVGEVAGNAPNPSHQATGLPPAYAGQGAYQLEKKFEAEAGLDLAYDPDLFDPPGDMDVDGDDQLDIPMFIHSPNDGLTGMVVRDAQTRDVLWQFAFPAEHRANLLKGFHGFADANGDGEKEALFGENLAVTLDGTVHTIAENFVTLDVNDIDNDGFEDVIGLNTADSTVVIYGTMTATSVESFDPADIHFQLFQNYPNPFNPSTTISFSVQQRGEVELTIYNALGQAVRTLVNETRAAGQYSLTWNGRDNAGRVLSSGPYFYRLQVGEAVQTRRMLFLK